MPLFSLRPYLFFLLVCDWLLRLQWGIVFLQGQKNNQNSVLHFYLDYTIPWNPSHNTPNNSISFHLMETIFLHISVLYNTQYYIQKWLITINCHFVSKTFCLTSKQTFFFLSLFDTKNKNNKTFLTISALVSAIPLCT